MTTEISIPIDKEFINPNLFQKVFDRFVAPYIQVSNPSAYQWFLYGELSFKYSKLNLNDFLTLSNQYFSNKIDCFINEKVLEEINISSTDKHLFKEYIKFRFHLGFSFGIEFNPDFSVITITESEPMFMISTITNDELTIDEVILFLKKHSISTESYEIMFKFISKNKIGNMIYKVTNENKELIFKEINTLLLRNKEAIISLVKEKMLSFFTHQIKLLCETANSNKLLSY